MVENSSKQGFHYNKKELFEPITKAVTDTSQKSLEETKSTTKAIEELVESNFHVKALELMNKSRVIDSSLIRPTAKLLVPTNKRPFPLYDDPDNNYWNDYILNGENYNIWRDELVFKNSGKIFTSRGDVLKKITDYRFNKNRFTGCKTDCRFYG